MQVQHIGLVCRSERSADKFYQKFLGLEKGQETAVPATLIKPLFGIDMEMTMCNYTAPGVHFEIFFHDDPREFTGRIAHTCLILPHADELIVRAQNLGVPVRRVPKGEKWVTFIEDFDGNKFEIKQA
jgi:catechol 2,3-dioxygenase-like lactoylglutathione lyase family enzyme